MNINKKISTPIAILIIVVLAALVGGVFYWQFQEIKGKDSEVKVPEEESIQKSNIDNWETYTSKKYGFGFQYPSKYTATSEYTTTNPHDPKEFQVTIQHPQYPENLQAFVKKIPAENYEWSDPITGGRFWFDTEKNNWIRTNHEDKEVSTQPLQFATTTHGAIVYKLATGDVGVFIQEYVVFNKSTNKVIVFRYSGNYNAFDVQGVSWEEVDSFERVLEKVVKTSLFL